MLNENSREVEIGENPVARKERDHQLEKKQGRERDRAVAVVQMRARQGQLKMAVVVVKTRAREEAECRIISRIMVRITIITARSL